MEEYNNKMEQARIKWEEDMRIQKNKCMELEEKVYRLEKEG
jgi:hypothetical protein